MDTDGTQTGYDIPLTQSVAKRVRIPVIASGGAGSVEHFAQVLTDGGADAALAASLFHYGQLTITSVKAYLVGQGIAVR
jgi:cyclase